MATNIPDQISRTKVIPGISDHDIVFCELNVTPISRKQQRRKVWLFNKADWLGMAQHLEHTSNMSNKAYFPSPNHLWAHIKDAVHDAVVTYIPRKLAKRKDSCPWIDKDLRKPMKTRNRLYKRCKKSNDTYFTDPL